MIVEHSPDAVLLTTVDGRVLSANPAACEMLGRTEAEIRAVGRAGVAVTDSAAERFLAMRGRSGRARGVLTLRRKDGSTFLAEVASVLFEWKGDVLSSMSFHDVTDRERSRRALEILADAGRRLTASLDLATTLKSLTTLVVPALADVCTVDLVMPDGVERVAVAHRDPSRLAAFQDIRRRQMRSDTSGGVDYVLRTGEPSCVYALTDEWLQSATLDHAHFDAARKLGVRSFVSVPLVANDVTRGALTLMSDGGVPMFTAADLPLVRALGERATMAIENARRHGAAIEARKLRDEVLGVVAHDLRGPLNAIQITAAVLGRTSPSEEVETIRHAVRRADELIRDLLLVTKAESGNIPLEIGRHDVQRIVEEVRELHAPLAKTKKLAFLVTTDRGLPEVEIDRHRVVQMLSNLVGNAIKFTPPDGTIELRASANADRVCFEVTDSGVGIAPVDLPHVFDRYWQGKHTRDIGAGLGLAISRGIANAHGGDITVRSELGHGTTFEVALPRTPVLTAS